MFPGCLEHCNAEVTLSEYSRNIACRLGSITGLATTTAFTAVKNAIPTVVDIYIYIYIYINNKTKSDNLYITSTDYNKFTKYILDAKITEEN